MSDIFLSYANADRERVRPLAQSLEARGWSVFWDRKIPVGKTWDQVIEREIDTVQAIVVLWSAASAQSDWVKTEAREGKARGILIPALIEQTRLPLEFRQLQTANLIGWTAGSAHPEFDEFVSGLASLLRKAPAPEAYPSEMRTPVEPAREAEQAEPPTAETDDATQSETAQTVEGPPEQAEQRPQFEPPTAETDATQSETAQGVEGPPEQAEQRPQPEPLAAETDATQSETAQTVEGPPEQADQQSQPEPPTAKTDTTQSETAQTFEGLEDRQTGELLRGSEDSGTSTPTSNKRSLFGTLGFLIIVGLILSVAMRDTSKQEEVTSTASGSSVAEPPPAGIQPLATLKGHTDLVYSVAFAPDGKTLATGSGSRDQTVKLWDVTTGKELATLKGHTRYPSAVVSVAFAPDGKTLATVSWDMTVNVKLWDVATRKEARHPHRPHLLCHIGRLRPGR